MARILVTGASGFVAGYVIHELLARGHSVTGLDNLSKYGEVSRAYDDHPGYTPVVGNAADSALLAELLAGCDHFLANAAMIGGVAYMNELPYDILAENNRLVSAACDAAIRERQNGGRLRKVTYVSSSMVFEERGNAVSREGDELRIPPPATTYGFQKLAVEYYARAALRQYGLPYTIVRPFNCVGAGELRSVHEKDLPARNERLVRGHVVPDFVERALKRSNPFHILGNGQQIRPFTYAGDTAKGIVLAMEHPAALNKDFNLSTSGGLTIEDLARRIWEKVNPGVPISISYTDSYPDDVGYRMTETGKARELLGFKATTSLDTMLDEVISWVRHSLLSGDVPAVAADGRAGR
ncbi:NAD-dependent epimerase/dehydratase family protein [Streptomyces canus]|uniref:NAD-dependent epimerase/dehydratase family protein n=1 Tax=Streptomyces canus TaxID=58343 RepID=UPI003716EF8A